MNFVMALTSNLAPEICCNDIYIKIAVGNPILHYTWENGQFTTYAINIETNSPSFALSKSTIRRRYSEFVQFRKMLKSQHPAIQPPPLPSRSLFKNRFDPDFIEERSQGLEKFLQKVFSISLYLSNKTVHLFSQTKFSMDEISSIVIGGDINVCNSEPLPKAERINTKTDAQNSIEKPCGDSDCQICFDVTGNNTVAHNSKMVCCTPSLHVVKGSEDEVDDPSITYSYTPSLTGSSSSYQNSPLLSELSTENKHKSDKITLDSLCEISIN
ncbi:sorting nexin-10A-like isoform X1 [Centruroides sculpturatus]|uniref:sorting nexin-10A-like isoform X1 n=2 Tax=Centruroides sculpturatus TaxID=218467 RepID=UPI000C6D5ADE|nr:sorting nexin-10A-like isoform X1 [Centruroides sculpturatus]